MVTSLRRNSIWAVLEIVFSGVSLFVLYKYLLSTIGLHGLGVWSLVLATTSLARIADLGAATGLSRYVAEALATGKPQLASQYVDTALIANLWLYVAIGLLVYFPLKWGISFIMPQDYLMDAWTLMPYTIISLILVNLAQVLLGSLVGQHRSDIKSILIIISLIVQIALTVALVPRLGIVGLAIAQIMQHIFTIISARLISVRMAQMDSERIIPFNFSFVVLRNIISFGLKLQALSINSMLFEPIIKFLMSYLYGVEALGIFELSYRMVLQIRHIVASPMSVLIPAFAHLRETEPENIANLYERSVANTAIFGLPLLFSATAVSPLVSWFWLGRVDHLFVSCSAVLSFAWMFNLLATPAWFLALGYGMTKWNMLSSFSINLISLFFGFVIGINFGPLGVALGAMLGLLAGSAICVAFNCRSLHVKPLPSVSVLFDCLNVAQTFVYRTARAVIRSAK